MSKQAEKHLYMYDDSHSIICIICESVFYITPIYETFESLEVFKITYITELELITQKAINKQLGIYLIIYI